MIYFIVRLVFGDMYGKSFCFDCLADLVRDIERFIVDEIVRYSAWNRF